MLPLFASAAVSLTLFLAMLRKLNPRPKVCCAKPGGTIPLLYASVPDVELERGLQFLGISATSSIVAHSSSVDAPRSACTSKHALEDECDVIYVNRVTEEEEVRRPLMSNKALTRIHREWKDIEGNPPVDWRASPVTDSNGDLDYLDWHFTFRGPPDSEFSSGVYHGRICLPSNYPFGPPSFKFLTPNGRFEVNAKICLSVSSAHPEQWQPAWGIRTMIEALRTFMATPSPGAIGSIEWPKDKRLECANLSLSYTCPQCKTSNSVILGLPETSLENGASCEDGEVLAAVVSPQGAEPARNRGFTCLLLFCALIVLIVVAKFYISRHSSRSYYSF